MVEGAPRPPNDGKDWSEAEVLLALDLYLNRPKTQTNPSMRDVRELARLVGRTPDSVALKVSNIQSADPEYKSRGRVGMPNTGKMEGPLFEAWHKRPEELKLVVAELREKLEEGLAPAQPASGKEQAAQTQTWSSAAAAAAKKASREAGADAGRVVAKTRDPGKQKKFSKGVMGDWWEAAGEAGYKSCPGCGHSRIKANGAPLLEGSHLVPWTVTASFDSRWGAPLCPNCHSVTEIGSKADRKTIVERLLKIHPRVLDNLLELQRAGLLDEDARTRLAGIGIKLPKPGPR
ncbi:MAG: hypothetical protein AABX89_02240 [Candidatus Thermoplasmatota archaeon]